MEEEHIQIGRTKEGNIFEVTCALLISVLWMMIAVSWNHLPDMLPMHFDISGVPDRWEGKGSLIVFGFIATITVGVMLATAYFPKTSLHVGVTVRNTKQMRLGMRMVRILAVMVSVLMLTGFFIIRNTALHRQTEHLESVIFTMTAAIILVIAYYAVRMVRAGR